MRASIAFLLALALSAAFPVAQTRTAKTLDIYVVDVEGGNATLFVSPSGESLLIDAGNTGAGAARDVTVANGRNRFSKTYGVNSRVGTN